MCPAECFDDIFEAGWKIRNMYHELITYTEAFPPDPDVLEEVENGPTYEDKEKVVVTIHLQNYFDGRDPDAGWRQGKPIPELIEKAKEAAKVFRVITAGGDTIGEAFNQVRRQIGLPEASEEKTPVLGTVTIARNPFS